MTFSSPLGISFSLFLNCCCAHTLAKLLISSILSTDRSVDNMHNRNKHIKFYVLNSILCLKVESFVIDLFYFFFLNSKAAHISIRLQSLLAYFVSLCSFKISWNLVSWEASISSFVILLFLAKPALIYLLFWSFLGSPWLTACHFYWVEIW